MRSAAREAVYKFLFAKLFNDEIVDKFFDGLLNVPEINQDDGEFARRLKTVIDERYGEISDTIAKFSKEYSFNRIFSTDKCALFIGIAEMKYFDDVPNAVAIDETMKLVSKYSTERSLSFVNGILASVEKECNNER